MARLDIPGNEWTTLPPIDGDVVVSGVNGGIWVSTEEVPGTIEGAHPLGAGDSIVLTAGLPIHVWPANHKGGGVRYMPV